MKKKYYGIILITIIVIIGTIILRNNNNDQEEYMFDNPAQPAMEEISKSLDSYMEKQVEYNNFHGTVLVKKGDDILLEKGYGMADYEEGIINTEKTIYPIGSVTKQFVAYGIVQLIEQGEIDYYDTVDEYIDGFPKGKEITIKQLLTHTSGIKSFGQLDKNLDDKIYSISPKVRNSKAIVDVIKQEKLESNPGEAYQYSNSGYLILGEIIETVSKMSLYEYLDKTIFIPLEMYNTQPAYMNDVRMFDSKGYIGYLESMPVNDYDKDLISILYGAGYLSSTASDLNKWAEAFENQEFINVDTVDNIFTSHVVSSSMGSDALYGYGYGWFVSHNSNEVMHDGSTDSFNSVVSKYLYDDINIIILSNKDFMSIDIHNLKDNLRNICIGKDIIMPQRLVETHVSENKLSSFYGTYSNLDYEISISLKKENENITAEILPKDLGIEPIIVYPASDNRFFAKDVMMNISFNEIKDTVSVDVAGYHIDFKKE